MPIEMNKKEKGNLVDFLITIFFRLVALFLLAFAIKYWIQILGIYDEPNSRFDIMAEHWQIACVILCVLLPVAAIGLWGKFPWGPVIWVIIIAIEGIMYFGLPHLFGANPPVLIFHAITFTLFLLLFGIGRLMAKKV